MYQNISIHFNIYVYLHNIRNIYLHNIQILAKYYRKNELKPTLVKVDFYIFNYNL